MRWTTNWKNKNGYRYLGRSYHPKKKIVSLLFAMRAGNFFPSIFLPHGRTRSTQDHTRWRIHDRAHRIHLFFLVYNYFYSNGRVDRKGVVFCTDLHYVFWSRNSKLRGKKRTCGMSFVHYELCTVLFAHTDERGQWCNISIHRIYALTRHVDQGLILGRFLFFFNFFEY